MSEREELLRALQAYVRPITFPVAVKVGETGDLPPKARRPQDLGQKRMAICQGIALARRVGWTFGFLEEDHACAPGMLAFGFKPDPDWVRNGELVYPLYAATPEAGAATQEKTPKMPVGKVKSLVFAPLERAPFEPDVVLVYGLPAQIVRLVQGALFEKGGAIESTFTGRCACASSIVVPYLTGECKVVLQGGGERVFGACGDEELCFAIPAAKMGEVARGLEGTHKQGAARIPTPMWNMMVQPRFPDKYARAEEYMGIR